LSGRISLSDKKRHKSEEIIAIQDIILDYILSNYWQDYKNFARILSEKILKVRPTNKQRLLAIIEKFSHSFFVFNEVSRKRFLKGFPNEEIINRLNNMPKQQTVQKEIVVVSPKNTKKKKSSVTFEQIFPEITEVDLTTAKTLVSSLDIEERIIQDELRDALREKGATNMVERKSESSLEFADLEDFTLIVNGRSTSFASAVKGYRSISGKNVSFKEIAHQVQKANVTNPDHVLLVLAKPPKDSVITFLVKYGKDLGNRNLVIIVDPVNLARFLRARNIL